VRILVILALLLPSCYLVNIPSKLSPPRSVSWKPKIMSPMRWSRIDKVRTKILGLNNSLPFFSMYLPSYTGAKIGLGTSYE
jgi:hypothetical protein